MTFFDLVWIMMDHHQSRSGKGYRSKLTSIISVGIKKLCYRRRPLANGIKTKRVGATPGEGALCK